MQARVFRAGSPYPPDLWVNHSFSAGKDTCPTAMHFASEASKYASMRILHAEACVFCMPHLSFACQSMRILHAAYVLCMPKHAHFACRRWQSRFISRGESFTFAKLTYFEPDPKYAKH